MRRDESGKRGGQKEERKGSGKETRLLLVEISGYATGHSFCYSLPLVQPDEKVSRLMTCIQGCVAACNVST